jgi:hypothetical protein
MVSIEEKLDVLSQHKKGEQIVDICHDVRFAHITIWLQYVIVLMELQKVPSQELKCLCSMTTTVLSEWTIPRTLDVSLMQFYCIRNK